MKLSDYIWYIKSLGIVAVILFFVFLLLFQSAQIVANIWLSNLSKDERIADIMNGSVFRYIDKLKGSIKMPKNFTMGNSSLLQQQAFAQLAQTAKANLESMSLQEKFDELLSDDDKYSMNDRVKEYMLIYLGLGVLQVVFIMLAGFVFAVMVKSSCRFIHKALLGKNFSIIFSCLKLRYVIIKIECIRCCLKTFIEQLIRAPMKFFDTQLTGRILNRFSRDLDVIDFQLPLTVRASSMMLGQLIAIFVAVGYSTPLTLIVDVPVVIVFFIFLLFFLPTSRQLRRLEAVTRSPVFNHVAETLQGAGGFSLESILQISIIFILNSTK